MSTTVSAHLSAEEALQLDELADLEGSDREELARVILRQGIKDLRLRRAVESYRRGEVSLSRAAELAAISQWDFLGLMNRESLEFHYGASEFEEDLRMVERFR